MLSEMFNKTSPGKHERVEDPETAPIETIASIDKVHSNKRVLVDGRIQFRKTSKGSFLLKSTDALSFTALQPEQSPRGLQENSKNAEVGRALIKVRENQTGPNVSIFYKQNGGLVLTSGKGIYVEDVGGNQYLDCCNNVACVGHSHPAVVEAGCKELARIQTNGRFLNEIQQRYLSKLLATFPPELNTVYMVNSGTEANDLALRMAREHTRARNPNDVIVLDSAYHGHSQSTMEISPYKWYQAVNNRNYQPNTTHVVSCPDGFRGPFPFGQTELSAILYAEEVERIVKLTGGVGTFIAESIVGCGGQIVPPPSYLQRCYAIVRSVGGVCIADEVQTGFGRTGTHFWMFQKHEVIPDIVTVGKPMGNGYPVAAVICKREVAESFASTGIEYFNTYGGNSVACAISEAVLDTIHKEKLQSNALEVGNYLNVQLETLKNKFQWIGEVRGVGLFQGIEFIKLKETKGALHHDIQPYPELAKFVVDFLFNEKILVSRDGPDENVIKIKPPLVFSKENVDMLVVSIENALTFAHSSNIF